MQGGKKTLSSQIDDPEHIALMKRTCSASIIPLKFKTNDQLVKKKLTMGINQTDKIKKMWGCLSTN